METNVITSAEPAFEFSEQQNTVIKSLSSAMRWVGAVMLVIGAVQCIAGALTLGADRGQTSKFAEYPQAGILQGAILIIFAVFTYKAAYAFRRIVISAGQDITHLMTALASLRALYRLQVIILAVAALALIVGFAAIAIAPWRGDSVRTALQVPG